MCQFYVNTTSFYMRDFSIHRFWYPRRIREPIPCEYWGTTIYPLTHPLYGLWCVFSITHGLSKNSDFFLSLFFMVKFPASLPSRLLLLNWCCVEILQVPSEVLIKSWVHTRNIHCNDYSLEGGCCCCTLNCIMTITVSVCQHWPTPSTIQFFS